jgi:hypothetical protein
LHVNPQMRGFSVAQYESSAFFVSRRID